MEVKMSVQKVAPEELQDQIFLELTLLEEQETEEALEPLGRKHKLLKL